MPPTAVLLALVVQTSGGAAPATIVTTAGRSARPVVIDGRDDDPVWREAPAITAFREFQPHEDGEPRFRTEARVAYDARNFYVFIRAFDAHPDSILQLLARRDVRAATDQLKIIIDSYHDRRSGYEFAVNPAGVKRDYAIYDDGNEDDAWDGVWEAAATVDSLGWTAEFRIPLSQVRYAPAASNTFGFAVWRDIQRYSERVSWPVYRVSRPGLSSQLGEVTGLTGLASPRRLELRPYAVTKNVSLPTPTGFDRDQRATVGADIKWGLTSNLTVDATVNPDFGQVEADPAVLNLSAFETFFQERRPFFLEGAGTFRFPVNCSAVNDCSTGEGLFYSRRVGRAPQLGQYGDATSPTATTILGAAKLTGRLAGGLRLGALDAVTDRAVGTAGRTMEPLTNYGTLRVQQDFGGGESSVGVMATAVDRHLDQWTEDVLRRSAYVAAFDFRHRFTGRRYEVSGSFDASRVTGSARAIAGTQRSPVHLYQRPDGELAFDSTRTVLWGHAEELRFAKVGGNLTRFETNYERRSPGFEVNDLGFLRRADQQTWNTWFAFQFNRPRSFYQRGFWNFNWWQWWTVAGGLATERAANTNAHFQLNSRWWVHGGVTVGGLGATFCDNCARGGPALRQEPYVSAWSGIAGDDRRVLIPQLWLNYWTGDAGRSDFVNVSPSLDMRVSSRFLGSVGFSVTRSTSDRQWYGNFTDGSGVAHYTFAHLEQRETSLTWRADYTINPDLTVQLYAQPFVSKGAYTNVRELANPRALDYDDRFQLYADPGRAFNFKQFRSNLVLRWEYRPGSTLFVVWTQGRQADQPAEGTRSFAGDFRDLFDRHPDNTFLVKASYWLNW